MTTWLSIDWENWIDIEVQKRFNSTGNVYHYLTNTTPPHLWVLSNHLGGSVSGSLWRDVRCLQYAQVAWPKATPNPVPCDLCLHIALLVLIREPILTNLGSCYILIIIFWCVFPFKSESSKMDVKKERNGKTKVTYLVHFKALLHIL